MLGQGPGQDGQQGDEGEIVNGEPLAGTGVAESEAMGGDPVLNMPSDRRVSCGSARRFIAECPCGTDGDQAGYNVLLPWLPCPWRRAPRGQVYTFSPTLYLRYSTAFFLGEGWWV